MFIAGAAGDADRELLGWVVRTVGESGSAFVLIWRDGGNRPTLPHWTEMMDTQTLLVMNVLFFALYAGVMLVNARTVGGSRGAMWFAGANLSRGAAVLLVATSGFHWLPVRVSEALTGVLAVSGVMMLHRSFSELLERGPLLRRVQWSLLGAMMAGMVYLLWAPSDSASVLILISGTLGIQYAVIASVVFRFSGEEVGPAGWLTGLAMSGYAMVLFVRALVTLRMGTRGYLQTSVEIDRVWLVSCMLANAAIAFGYMFLSSAKLRVELRWRAQVDELTGLLNRWALKRVAMREIERCRRARGRLAVLMMDLDGLKAINDEKGHGCGDVVLQTVAGVLQETVRGHDSVARVGGDEFCVLLPDTDLAEAMTAAERLRAEVEEMAVRYRGETMRIRASLGVASSEQCGLAWESLVDQSDAALYEAKRGGKNRVVMAEPAAAVLGVGELVEDRRRH
jgi:diguanylate cyclase (GGDEF)-like protein